ncbi:hypothetical protein G8759_13285 [Spirosoma aureum]|uniref:Uncharacterized protein n=1 Tax=Spirosoma aureum TaxID=2692134 RepID=A0A6G9AM53_9BACT|nr:hypothetical protein [Spirosoma aureum]QIP13527.1 hypothetical protein G8759_13285 [Spirosoma aureum]
MADIDNLRPLFFQLPPFRPAIKGWNRLEGRPRQADFERSLRAEVRDPLWMLTRQWQFGEFIGEDAGSPVDARMLTHQTYLNRYAVKGGPAQPLPIDIPLETRVEREAWPDDLGSQVRTGRYFEKLLRKQGVFSTKNAHLTQYSIRADEPNTTYDKDTDQTREAVAGKIINGGLLVKAIRDGSYANWVDLTTPSTDYRTKQKDAANELMVWLGQFSSQPLSDADNAWAASNLEYQFACAADDDTNGSQVVLQAEQYENGQLDWYSFDVDIDNKLEAPEGSTIEPIKSLDECLSFIPAPVSFQGMPNPRFWQMESERIEFAQMDVNTTDVIKLIMTEFMLLYSNDWCVFPYERKIGSLCNIRGLVVTDVFGQRTNIRSAGSTIDHEWTRWSFFRQHAKADASVDLSLLLPALGKPAESQPVEKVNFIRDEMSNMVWAIESVIPSPLGRGVNGYESALAAQNATLPPPITLLPTAAKIRYILGTSVPYNWIPFIPVQVPNNNRDIQLQRARMPDSAALFKGEILDETAPYFIHEEEVPRSGKLITRTYQRTRTPAGNVALWVGRKVTVGRGEGSSGLGFDQLMDLEG